MEIMKNPLTDVEIIIFEKLQEIVNMLLFIKDSHFHWKSCRWQKNPVRGKGEQKNQESKETIDAGRASLSELDRKLEGFVPTTK